MHACNCNSFTSLTGYIYFVILTAKLLFSYIPYPIFELILQEMTSYFLNLIWHGLAIIGVYFELNGVVHTNNSAASLLEVGEGENALLCKTNREGCCGTPQLVWRVLLS